MLIKCSLKSQASAHKEISMLLINTCQLSKISSNTELFPVLGEGWMMGGLLWGERMDGLFVSFRVNLICEKCSVSEPWEKPPVKTAYCWAAPFPGGQEPWPHLGAHQLSRGSAVRSKWAICFNVSLMLWNGLWGSVAYNFRLSLKPEGLCQGPYHFISLLKTSL